MMMIIGCSSIGGGIISITEYKCCLTDSVNQPKGSGFLALFSQLDYECCTCEIMRCHTDPHCEDSHCAGCPLLVAQTDRQ